MIKNELEFITEVRPLEKRYGLYFMVSEWLSILPEEQTDNTAMWWAACDSPADVAELEAHLKKEGLL